MIYVYGDLEQWAMDPLYGNPEFWIVTGKEEFTGDPTLVKGGYYISNYDGSGAGNNPFPEYEFYEDARDMVEVSDHEIWQCSSDIGFVPYMLAHYDPLTRLVELVYS